MGSDGNGTNGGGGGGGGGGKCKMQRTERNTI